MNAREAKRRVCSGAAAILNDDSANLWLRQDDDGNDLSEADSARMLAAFKELVAELRLRGQKDKKR